MWGPGAWPDDCGDESAALHLSCASRNPAVALRVIAALSHVCGPLVAIPGGTWPALISPGSAIEAILDVSRRE